MNCLVKGKSPRSFCFQRIHIYPDKVALTNLIEQDIGQDAVAATQIKAPSGGDVT